ncbi:hypothetical protein GGF32_002877 [Allomyces javanicus]|nr:hypothetical protein GGF32_002877 [Allomyces javanicus]
MTSMSHAGRQDPQAQPAAAAVPPPPSWPTIPASALHQSWSCYGPRYAHLAISRAIDQIEQQRTTDWARGHQILSSRSQLTPADYDQLYVMWRGHCYLAAAQCGVLDAVHNEDASALLDAVEVAVNVAHVPRWFAVQALIADQREARVERERESVDVKAEQEEAALDVKIKSEPGTETTTADALPSARHDGGATPLMHQLRADLLRETTIQWTEYPIDASSIMRFLAAVESQLRVHGQDVYLTDSVDSICASFTKDVDPTHQLGSAAHLHRRVTTASLVIMQSINAHLDHPTGRSEFAPVKFHASTNLPQYWARAFRHEKLCSSFLGLHRRGTPLATNLAVIECKYRDANLLWPGIFSTHILHRKIVGFILNDQEMRANPAFTAQFRPIADMLNAPGAVGREEAVLRELRAVLDVVDAQKPPRDPQSPSLPAPPKKPADKRMFVPRTRSAAAAGFGGELAGKTRRDAWIDGTPRWFAVQAITAIQRRTWDEQQGNDGAVVMDAGKDDVVPGRVIKPKNHTGPPPARNDGDDEKLESDSDDEYDPEVDCFRWFTACRGTIDWDEYPIDETNIMRYLDAVQRFLWGGRKAFVTDTPEQICARILEQSGNSAHRLGPAPFLQKSIQKMTIYVLHQIKFHLGNGCGRGEFYYNAAASYSSLPAYWTWLLDSVRTRDPFWHESFLHRFMVPRAHLPLVAQLKLVEYTFDDTNTLWPDLLPPVFLPRRLHMFLCDPNLRVHASLATQFWEIVDKLDAPDAECTSLVWHQLRNLMETADQWNLPPPPRDRSRTGGKTRSATAAGFGDGAGTGKVRRVN